MNRTSDVEPIDAIAIARSDRDGAERLGFGGGCHWCTEAVFQALRGVERVDSGFAAADAPDDAFSEAALVTFDPAAVPAAVLIEAHLLTHASASDHALRGRYRSAVYVERAARRAEGERILAALAAGRDAPPVTRALGLRAFRPCEERYRDYCASDPSRPFCRTYVDPKLEALRERFGREGRIRAPGA